MDFDKRQLSACTKRYWVEITTSFCGMPPTSRHDFFYSDSENPEEDFKQTFLLDEGEKLVNVSLSEGIPSKLTKRQLLSTY